MEAKICKKCNVEKELCEFVKDKSKKSGVRGCCKECNRKKYYKNRENILKEKKEYYIKNREEIIEKVKTRNILNFEKRKKYLKEYVPKYRKKNLKKLNSYHKIRNKEKRKKDPIFRLINSARSAVNRYLNKKNLRTFDIIGCSPQELKEHLEKQFKEGMNWENHGKYGWHIDHIIPLSSAKNEDELKKLCYYKNLQPLWALENILKKDKLIY
jgi:hypothetical protein